MKKEKKISFKIEEYTSFTFTYEHNAVNTAMALAQAGYFVNIIGNVGNYQVSIFKRK